LEPGVPVVTVTVPLYTNWAILKLSPMEIEMTKELNLPAQRDIIIEMMFNLIQSLLPEDSDGLSADAEHKMMEIYSALSYALQIPEEDSI